MLAIAYEACGSRRQYRVEMASMATRSGYADFVAALFRSIWGAEPRRLPYLNRPSFFGEILCCWRPRWIQGAREA
jgi:hypothetical protein